MTENEIILQARYAACALDLPKEERSNWAYDFESDERLGVYLTNTLERHDPIS
jgi:hypothetical protein